MKWSDGAASFSTGNVTAFIEESLPPLTAGDSPDDAVDATTDVAKPEVIEEEGGNDTEIAPEAAEDGATDDTTRGPEPEKAFYIFGFEQSGFKKTQYIDFTADILANACNSKIKAEVLKLPAAAEVEAANTAPPVKGKGAPPPAEETPSLETVLMECVLPSTK